MDVLFSIVVFIFIFHDFLDDNQLLVGRGILFSLCNTKERRKEGNDVMMRIMDDVVVLLRVGMKKMRERGEAWNLPKVKDKYPQFCVQRSPKIRRNFDDSNNNNNLQRASDDARQ